MSKFKAHDSVYLNIKGNEVEGTLAGVDNSDGIHLFHSEGTGLITAFEKDLKLKPTAGVKFDQDKPSMSSIPKEAMWEMGLALGYGAKKYGDGNYRNGMLVSRQLAAAVRHIYQHLDGQDLDSESSVTHIGHALASLAMAAYTLKNHPDMDDRNPRDKAKHAKAT